jgi:hypothetical protein
MTHAGPVESRYQVSINLYCWPCRTVHQFELGDVEKIVYALGAAATVAEHASYIDGWQDADDGKPNSGPDGDTPMCLKIALRDADQPEVFAEHTEQGIECREKSE